MKDILLAAVRDEPDAVRRRNRAREFLQARILLSLQDRGAFADWAFVGGTALRFLFNLPRYSEDLDFSLAAPERDPRFAALLRGVKSDLEAEAYAVDVRAKEKRTVASAMVKFRGVLFDLGISAHRDEAFSVKVEIDTNPPAGAVLKTRLIRRHYLLTLSHYDEASLLAGKMHAVFTRKYAKGRDLYDLMWYLAAPDWPGPNMDLLNAALRQTGWTGPELSSVTWREALARRLDEMNWDAVREDVAPFLERADEAALLTRETFTGLLSVKGRE